MAQQFAKKTSKNCMLSSYRFLAYSQRPPLVHTIEYAIEKGKRHGAVNSGM